MAFWPGLVHHFRVLMMISRSLKHTNQMTKGTMMAEVA